MIKRSLTIVPLLLCLGMFADRPAVAADPVPIASPVPGAAVTTGAIGVSQFHFVADKQTFRANGARLEGHARITSPQLDVAADVINFAFNARQIEKVTARGSVHFKAELTPQGGGVASHIEADCAMATLEPATRSLLLDGGVQGYYSSGPGPRNSLAGQSASLRYNDAKNLVADIEGGAAGVKVVLPPENIAVPTSIGTVTITAGRATLNTQTGLGEFVGNARAVSTDSANKFEVAAPVFTVSRSAAGTIDTLTTRGRTLLKFDLPPDAVVPAVGAVAPPIGTVAPQAAGDAGPGKPTHFEVEADAALVKRETGTLTLTGAVRGFYLLSRPNAEPTRQDFSSDRAVIRYVTAAQATADNPAGLQIEMTGKPVSIAAPLTFNF